MRIKSFVGLLTILLVAVSLGLAQENPKKPVVQKEKTVSCAVCGMKMLPSQAGAKTTYKGKNYYFCSTREEAKFEKNPEKYVSQIEKAVPAKGVMKGKAQMGHSKAAAQKALTSGVAIDPVCGMKVNPEKAKFKTTYKGHKYYFCARSDLEKFKKNPSQYVK